MVGPALAAGRYLHWGVIQISLTNLLVIVAMIVVFVAALLLRMPGSSDPPARAERSTGEERSDDAG